MPPDFVSLNFMVKRIGLLFGTFLLTGCGTAENITEFGLEDLGLRPIRIALPPALGIEEILTQNSLQQVIERYHSYGNNKALAISEDGFWGLGGQTNSIVWAKWEAMRDCTKKVLGLVREGINGEGVKQTLNFHRGCFVYMVNDEIFPETNPDVVEYNDYTPPPRQYDLSMGNKVKAAFAEHQLNSINKAFAISPAGSWGTAYAFEYPEDAVKRAINLCNSAMPYYGDAQCHLYSINGAVVMPTNPEPTDMAQ